MKRDWIQVTVVIAIFILMCVMLLVGPKGTTIRIEMRTPTEQPTHTAPPLGA